MMGDQNSNGSQRLSCVRTVCHARTCVGTDNDDNDDNDDKFVDVVVVAKREFLVQIAVE
jgi:hypothetical protein